MLVNIPKYRKLIKPFVGLSFLLMSFVATAQSYTLEECIETVLENNTKIKLAQQDIQIARGNQAIANTAFKPKVEGTVDYKYYISLPYQLLPAAVFGGPEGAYKEAQFGVPHNLNVNVVASMPVYNPVVRNAIDKTNIVIELKELMQEKTKEELVLETTNIYYNAQILLSTLDFIDKNRYNAQKLNTTISLLHEQLLAKGTDVDKVLFQIEQLQSKKATVQNQYQQVLNGLKFLMGKPIDEEISIIPDTRQQASVLPEPKLSIEIQLLQKNMELKAHEIEGFNKSKLPTVALYGMYGTTGYGATGTNSFFDLYPIGFVGAKATIPIFDGSMRKRKIELSQLEAKQLSMQEQLVNDKAKLEIKNAELEYASSEQAIKESKSQIALAEKIYESTVLQHKQGLANITDILLADNSVREAQQNLLVAFINLKKAELEYKRASANLL